MIIRRASGQYAREHKQAHTQQMLSLLFNSMVH